MKPREYWVHLKSELGEFELSKGVYFTLEEAPTKPLNHEVVRPV